MLFAEKTQVKKVCLRYFASVESQIMEISHKLFFRFLHQVKEKFLMVGLISNIFNSFQLLFAHLHNDTFFKLFHTALQRNAFILNLLQNLQILERLLIHAQLKVTHSIIINQNPHKFLTFLYPNYTFLPKLKISIPNNALSPQQEFPKTHLTLLFGLKLIHLLSLDEVSQYIKIIPFHNMLSFPETPILKLPDLQEPNDAFGNLIIFFPTYLADSINDTIVASSFVP